MFPPLIITLRETLEASLVVGIVLAFLHRTQNQKYDFWVWLGVGAGVAVSLALAWLFSRYSGGFTGRAEYLYEGFTMLSAAALITWMVVWMARQGKFMRRSIENKIAFNLQTKNLVGIASLTFLSVVREGIETVLFLHAAFLQSQSAYQNLGAVLGMALAIGFSIILFKTMNQVSLRYFFNVTTILLLLFAAGLVAHGIHELQTAGLVPTLIEPLWDTTTVLNERGTIGSIFKGVFGYNANPSLIEAGSYLLYLGLMVLWFKRANSKH